MSEELKQRLQKLKDASLKVGVAGVLLTVLGLILNREVFASSYLIAYLFWLGITVGALPLLMIHHLTGGHWGYPIRRPLEIIASLVPWLALGFIPIIFFLQELYPWARPEVIATDKLVQKKVLYLNVPFFLARAGFYFLVWTLLAFAFYRGSLALESSENKSAKNRLQLLGGVGLILYSITVTFASYDWGMSLEPHWFSTMYGVLFMVGQGVAAFAFTLVLAGRLLARDSFFAGLIPPSRSHDLGKLLFAFIMVWAYVSLSQFIIIWSGNISELTPWYIKRFDGGWKVLSIILTLFHFVIPFMLLLGREVKRNLRILTLIALVIVLMRWVDLFWLLKPAFFETITIHWLDLACFAGVGGLWLSLLFNKMLKTPLHMKSDPLLNEKLKGPAS